MTAYGFHPQSLMYVGSEVVKEEPRFNPPFVRGNFKRRRRITHQHMMAFRRFKKSVLRGEIFQVSYTFEAALVVDSPNVCVKFTDLE